MKFFIAIALFLFPVFTSYSETIVTVSAGTIYEPSTVSVSIANPGDKAVHYKILSACSCLSPQSRTIDIPAGKTGNFDVRIDTAEYSGDFSNFIILQAKDNSRQLVKITAFIDKDIGDTGNCSSCEEVKRQIEHEAKLTELRNSTLSIHIRYSDNTDECRTCQWITDEYIRKLQEEFNMNLKVESTADTSLTPGSELLYLGDKLFFHGPGSKDETLKSLYTALYNYRAAPAEVQTVTSEKSEFRPPYITIIILIGLGFGIIVIAVLIIKKNRRS